MCHDQATWNGGLVIHPMNHGENGQITDLAPGTQVVWRRKMAETSGLGRKMAFSTLFTWNPRFQSCIFCWKNPGLTCLGLWDVPKSKLCWSLSDWKISPRFFSYPLGLGQSRPGWWLTKPLWKIWKSIGMMKFPTEWKNVSHVPNHQPETHWPTRLMFGDSQNSYPLVSSNVAGNPLSLHGKIKELKSLSSSHVWLLEGKYHESPSNHHFPMVFLWFSNLFSTFFGIKFQLLSPPSCGVERHSLRNFTRKGRSPCFTWEGGNCGIWASGRLANLKLTEICHLVLLKYQKLVKELYDIGWRLKKICFFDPKDDFSWCYFRAKGWP